MLEEGRAPVADGMLFQPGGENLSAKPERATAPIEAEAREEQRPRDSDETDDRLAPPSAGVAGR